MNVFDHLEGFPDLPPIWLLGFGIMAWLLARFLPLATLPAFLSVPGSLLIVAGAGLIIWAALWFFRKRTRIEPRQKPTALIVEGPYRVSRNPIYLGMALMLLGYALTKGGVSALVTVPLFMLVIQTRFIHGEEAGLKAAFGSEADAYLARTGRWLNGFGR